MTEDHARLLSNLAQNQMLWSPIILGNKLYASQPLGERKLKDGFRHQLEKRVSGEKEKINPQNIP